MNNIVQKNKIAENGILTPNPPQAEAEATINEIAKSPYRACPDISSGGLRGHNLNELINLLKSIKNH